MVVAVSSFQRQYKKPLDTCPEELLVHYLGDCHTCHRAMAPNRLIRRVPALREWFLHANNSVQCRSCYSHQNEDRKTDPRQSKKRLARAAMGPDIIRGLRAALGACVECGWLAGEPGEDGTIEGHEDRECPTQRENVVVEPRSSSGHDLRETA